LADTVLGIFLDSETNGLNPGKHRILEIAFKILDVATGELKEEFQSTVAVTYHQWEKSDPESLNINGFTWLEANQAPACNAVSDQIKTIFARHEIKRGKAVFICQNPSFDRVFFSQLIDPDEQEKMLWPYHWLDLASMYWAKTIGKSQDQERKLPWETGYTKDKIASAMHLPSEEKPHRAMKGVDHLLLCYQAVVGFPLINNS
jgi:oligoribonuclease